MKIAVTGSSGLIGRALVASLRADGHAVVPLVRRPPRAAQEVRWDPRAADGGLSDLSGLAGVTACVHLAGAGVGDRRWTRRYKTEIRSSRVLGTRALAGALARLRPAPSVLIAASGIGWYGAASGPDDIFDETAPAGRGFLADVVRDWEAAAEPARAAGIRVVHTRSALVLAKGGGLLGRMVPVVTLTPVSLLPRFGSGSQRMNWISLADQVGAVRFVLDRPDISGPVNLTAPAPATNAEFTAALAAALHRRDLPWLKVPAFALRLGLGEASAELLTDMRVAPRRLLEAGFHFRYPDLPSALAAELS